MKKLKKLEEAINYLRVIGITEDDFYCITIYDEKTSLQGKFNSKITTALKDRKFEIAINGYVQYYFVVPENAEILIEITLTD